MVREVIARQQRRAECSYAPSDGAGLVATVTQRRLRRGFNEDRVCSWRGALHCVLAGQGVFNGQQISAGTWFWFARGQAYRLASAAGMRQISYGFYPPGEALLVERLGPIGCQAAAPAQLRADAERSWKEAASPRRWQVAAIESCLHLIIIALARAAQDGPSADERLLARAEAAIDAGDVARLDVAAVARLCGVSAAHLARRYRALTGSTVQDAIRRRRMNMAVDLLEQGGRQEAIAATLGYADAAAFNKAFKRWYGAPPGRY